MAPLRTTLPTLQHQRGAIFIVMLVIMIMGLSFYLVSAMSKVTLQAARNEKTGDMLALAKEVVIGYAVNGTGGGQRPGDLLYPDVLSETPPNYDGNTEGGCLDVTQPAGLPLVNSGANMRCLGRLPWKAFSMPIASPSENDPTGFMPWYAISANMVDTGITPFNSDLLNSAPHPWLTVRDMKGNVLSNRVAFVILIPGPALPGQSRPSFPNLGGADQYLDQIGFPAGCNPNPPTPTCTTIYKNYGTNDEFIMGDEHRWIDDPANPGKQIEDPNYNFNDKLLYVTIDDLMQIIVKRVAGEAGSSLRNYYSATGQFPYAAALGSSGTYSLVPGNDSGMLPLDLGSCSCASFTNCSCSFSLVASVAYKRGSTLTWSATNVSGACTRTSTQVCTCTGAGYCQNSTGSRNFTCDSFGNCSHNTTSGNFIFAPPSYGNVASTANGCTLNGGNAECNSFGSFTIRMNFPSWFTNNNWQDDFYYRRSNTANLQAGTQTGIKALLIGAGAPIISPPYASKGAAQIRPSTSLDDYLDSIENTNSDLVFDATNKALSSSYNDQVFIVGP